MLKDYMIRKDAKKSEKTGLLTSTILPTLAGYFGAPTALNIFLRLIGEKQVTESDPEYKTSQTAGALLGLGLGAGGKLLGALSAAVTPRRSKPRQRAYEKSSLQDALNYLVPGAAAYNALKSEGRLIGDEEENA